MTLEATVIVLQSMLIDMCESSPFHGYGCNGKGILHIHYNWPMSCWPRPVPTIHWCHTGGKQVLDTKKKA